MNKAWIGVDLDGTLAHYDGWQGVEHIGEPITPMVERVKSWLEQGIRVKIFTARVSGSDSLEALIPIEQWCRKHLGQVLEVTNVKDFGMIDLWDDRAIQVQKNTGIPINEAERKLCKQNVCMYCGGRALGYDRIPDGPNDAGNWTHQPTRKEYSIVLCQASAIFAREKFEKECSNE